MQTSRRACGNSTACTRRHPIGGTIEAGVCTAIVTRNWVAVHRKHHAKCETPDDPHSPQVCGLNKVLFDGVDLYSRAAAAAETVERYGHRTPDDALERHLYGRHRQLGIGLMLVIDVSLFGPIGLTV
jgi:stearoyl-CoA desaturase (delta-9 desaturase)